MNDTLDISTLPKVHPVSVYFEEKELIMRLVDEITYTDPKTEYQKYYNNFNQLHTLERRFERK